MITGWTTLAHSLVVFAAFTALLFLPGYALGSRLSVLPFTHPAGRLAVGSGIAVTGLPLVAGALHLAGIGLRGVAVVWAGLCLLAGAWLVAHVRAKGRMTWRRPRIGGHDLVVLAIVLVVLGWLAVTGNANGLGYDEWTHVSSQQRLVDHDIAFAPEAFSVVERDDGARLTSYHDAYDLWFAVAASWTRLPTATVLFSSAAWFGVLTLAAVYTLGRAVARHPTGGLVAVISYLVLFGGFLVRVSNTRSPAEAVLAAGLALVIHWLAEDGEARTLVTGLALAGGAVAVHTFYLSVVAFGVAVPLALVLAASRDATRLKRLLRASLIAALILLPYLGPKTVTLVKQAREVVETPVSTAATPPVETPPTTDEPLLIGGLQWIGLPGGLRVLHPVELVRNAERFTLLVVLVGGCALLVLAGLRRTPHGPVVLAVGTMAGLPLAWWFIPVLAEVIATATTPARLLRIAPVQLLGPMVAAAAVLVIRSRRRRGRDLAAIAPFLMVVVALLVRPVADAATYPARLSEDVTQANQRIAAVRSVVDVLPEHGVTVVTDPVDGLLLNVFTPHHAVYAAPRYEITDPVFGRSYDDPSKGRAAEEILLPDSPWLGAYGAMRELGAVAILVEHVAGPDLRGAGSLLTRHPVAGLDLIVRGDPETYLAQVRHAVADNLSSGDVERAAGVAGLAGRALGLAPTHPLLTDVLEAVPGSAPPDVVAVDEYVAWRRRVGAMNLLGVDTREETAVLRSIRSGLGGPVVSTRILGPEDATYGFTHMPEAYERVQDSGRLLDGQVSYEDAVTFDWPRLGGTTVTFALEQRHFVRRLDVQTLSPFDNYRLRSQHVQVSVDGVHFVDVEDEGGVLVPGEGSPEGTLGEGLHVFEYDVNMPATHVRIVLHGYADGGHTSLSEVVIRVEDVAQ